MTRLPSIFQLLVTEATGGSMRLREAKATMNHVNEGMHSLKVMSCGGTVGLRFLQPHQHDCARPN